MERGFEIVAHRGSCVLISRWSALAQADVPSQLQNPLDPLAGVIKAIVEC